MLADLEYVNAYQPALLSQSSQKILNKISSGKSLEGAKDCSHFDLMAFSPGFDSTQANKYSAQIPRLWYFALRSDAASMIIESHLCRAKAFLPVPFSNAPGYTNWTIDDIFTLNPFSIHRTTIVPGIHLISLIWLKLWENNGGLLAWPGLHLTIIMVCAWILSNKSRNKTEVQHSRLPIVFLLSHTLVLIGFTTAQDFRYAYSLYFFSLPMMTAVAFPNFKTMP
jgi:hypothetical protein